jgi:hypothetical protein
MPGTSCELDAGLKETEAMINLSSRAEARNSEVSHTFTIATYDRAWWAEEAASAGTHWSGVVEAAVKMMVAAGIVAEPMTTFPETCAAADARARTKRNGASPHYSRAQSAALTTVEALMLALRRGVNELAEPDTLRRLSALKGNQVRAVCRRVQAFKPEIAPPWSAEEAATLIAKWREFHGRCSNPD